VSSKPVILIVNEQTFLVDLLTQTLRNDDLIVVGSTDAGYAAVLFGERVPNLAVVDPELPGGMELVHLIRSSPDRCALIALTTSAEMRSLLHEMGVETVIHKAVSLKVLLRTIYSFVQVDPAIPHTTADATILVVDDEEEIRHIQATILRRKGYSVVTAGDGNEALHMLEHDNSIAVVLLDVQIPGRGGLDVLREISLSKNPAQVIMVTSMVDEQIARHSRKLGAFDYVLKPIEPEALEGVIIASLSHAAYQRQSLWQRLWN
jgi:DNA-binding response OmpR family regulator